MVAIFLLLGAVVNVAVAWSQAVIPWPKQEPLQLTEEETLALWDHYVRSETLVVNLQGYRWKAPCADLQGVVGEYGSDTDWMPAEMCSILRGGWPMRCLEGETFYYGGTLATGLPETHAVSLVSLPRHIGSIPLPAGTHLLPLRPRWLGFVVDTAFYALILWLPIRGPFALRRHIRRKRGLCVACGYDLRHADHAACPECGAVAKSATA